MPLKALNKLSGSFSRTQKMPVLFLGHGSPMNGIEENVFVEGFKKVGEEIQYPRAILCISAHWETKGTYVTAMENPRTIHDFGGFPQALFDVQYPAPGSPSLAQETKDLITNTKIGLNESWGLDHGAWSVVKHLYPKADVPIIQMSLDYTKPAKYHFELAQQLSLLRQKGVLIIGSGNMVHNLGKVAWDKLQGEPFAFEWAIEANEKMKAFIEDGDFQSLIDFRSQGRAFDLAIPTPEHYLPLLYALALKEKKDETTIFNDQPIGGSLSMTSVKFN
ncbi:4,5-DOPA dioxygenase extradiol [uncultured Cyclobacterium sp.]|uniref:4,5-DOPA-extradiol-dioxygenase n=1 Tax=uncultured Cyclobacterium sp. TaxID=453820 RepID=UPI0030EB313C|tara:strand:+ start:107103 stop:107930 length:828 start_codon:yes stop_codon:yes gene_type:complete